MESKKKEDPVTELKHLHILRGFLITIGSWPTEIFEPQTHRQSLAKFTLVLACLIIIGEIMYIQKNISVLSFFDLGNILMTVFLTALSVVRATLPILPNYPRIIKSFVTEFHLIHFRHKGGYYEKTYNKINKFSHYFTMVMVLNMIMGPTLFNLVPLYTNYVNGAFQENRTADLKLQSSMYMSFPGYTQEDHLLVSTIMDFFLSCICSILICATEILMYLMAFQIIGHIQILLHDLQQIPRPKRPIVFNAFFRETNEHNNLNLEIYDGEDNNLVRNEIVNLVEHHKFIVRLVR
uniref:Olfactory receptor n=1 Tax=Glyphodes pyloalis TaxID=1242752 RepID=A0A6M3GVM8_GLYPY|nr:olfactory receptor [Glyphodes pyloalis]